MSMLIYINGQFYPESEAQISVYDRGLQFGDGLYEVARVYSGQVFGLQEHLERMISGAKAIHIPLKWSIDDLRNIVLEVVQQNSIEDGLIYWQLTRGTALRTHAFPPSAQPNLIAYPLAFTPHPELAEKGINAVVEPDQRWLMCNVKSTNLLGNVLAKEAAKQKGAQEALLERTGYGVIEGSSSNLYIVRDGTIRTAPLSNLILPGITRHFVLQIAEKLDIPVRKEYFDRTQLYNAHEVFISSTSLEVMPVVQIDDRTIGSGKPGPITRKLQAGFRQLVN